MSDEAENMYSLTGKPRRTADMSLSVIKHCFEKPNFSD